MKAWAEQAERRGKLLYAHNRRVTGYDRTTMKMETSLSARAFNPVSGRIRLFGGLLASC